MAISDRLPAVWPAEPNLGGVHLTVRYAAVPVFLALGLASLAGLVPFAHGMSGLALAGVGLLAAGVSLVEARTKTCPGYSVMGLNTCPLPEVDASTPSGAEEPA